MLESKQLQNENWKWDEKQSQNESYLARDAAMGITFIKSDQSATHLPYAYLNRCDINATHDELMIHFSNACVTLKGDSLTLILEKIAMQNLAYIFELGDHKNEKIDLPYIKEITLENKEAISRYRHQKAFP